MKRTSLLLLIFISLTAFTCENETLDFEVEEAVSPGAVNNPGTIVGTWRAVSLDADIQTATTIIGITTNAITDIVGENLDYTVTFTEDSYISQGSYSVSVSTSFDGMAPVTSSQASDNVSESGTYQNTGPNTMLLDNPFYTLSVPGVDTSAVTGEQQELQYTLSADGQTLTFVQNQQDTQSLVGFDISVSVISTSVFTRE
ncbi:MAG: hypothetical protein AAF617_13305 [Bacteroidota bacterium]